MLDGRDFQGIDTNIIFPAGSVGGDMVCTDIRICDNRAFQKTRNFSVHISVKEEGDRGSILIPNPYATVLIFDVDSK